MDLDDLAVPVVIALMASLDSQFVSHCCSHHSPPFDTVLPATACSARLPNPPDLLSLPAAVFYL